MNYSCIKTFFFTMSFFCVSASMMAQGLNADSRLATAPIATEPKVDMPIPSAGEVKSIRIHSAEANIPVAARSMNSIAGDNAQQIAEGGMPKHNQQAVRPLQVETYNQASYAAQPFHTQSNGQIGSYGGGTGFAASYSAKVSTGNISSSAASYNAAIASAANTNSFISRWRTENVLADNLEEDDETVAKRNLGGVTPPGPKPTDPNAPTPLSDAPFFILALLLAYACHKRLTLKQTTRL